jgi:hypothetical protein
LDPDIFFETAIRHRKIAVNVTGFKVSNKFPPEYKERIRQD